MQAGNKGDRNPAPMFHHAPSVTFALVHGELGDGGGTLQGRDVC